MAAHPIDFADLSKRFGLTRQDVYSLALMLALAKQRQHQVRRVGPGEWEIDSYSEPGETRHQWLEGNRIMCDCPAATGDKTTNQKPRFCTHTAAVHLLLCGQRGQPPLVRPMPPAVLRYDPAPEAKAALALIAYPRQSKAPPAPAQEERQPAEAVA